MRSELSAKLAYRAAIKRYLAQLSELTNQKVTADCLTSLKEVESFMNNSTDLPLLEKKTYWLSPSDLTSEKFKSFVKRLEATNPSPVGVWLDGTKACGMFYIGGLSELNFQFRFSLVPDGVFQLITADARDSLLIVFDFDEVEMVIQGYSWSAIEY